MFNELNWAPLYDFFTKMLIFLDRPIVRLQLVTILSAILLAWFLEQVLRSRIQNQQLHLPDSLELYAKGFFIILKYLIFPLLGLVTISIAQQLLLSQGHLAGLTSEAKSLFWVLLLFRFCVGISYAVFDPSAVRRYHYLFYAPLFILYAIISILSDVTKLESLSRVVLTSISDNPLTIGSLFKAIVGLYIWIGVLSGIQDLLYLLLTKQTKAQPAVVEGVLTSIRYILIICGLILFMGQLGINATTVAAITGGLSVGIGLSLQEIIGNFISGIVLFFEGALKPGDVVEVDGEITVVKRVSIRSTTVQTFNHIEKIVPNQKFLTSSVVTYTGSDRISRYLIPVGVSYNSEPETVIEILLKVAKEHPNVLKKPKPVVFLIGFGDSSIKFELSVWLDNPIFKKRVTSELNQAIWQAFAHNKIEIPFPQRDLHIRDFSSWKDGKS